MLYRPSSFAFAVLCDTLPPVFILLHDRSSSASSRRPRLLPEPATIPRLAPSEPPPPLLPFSTHRASPSCPAPDGHRDPLPLLARLRASSRSPRPVPVLLLLGLPLCVPAPAHHHGLLPLALAAMVARALRRACLPPTPLLLVSPPPTARQRARAFPSPHMLLLPCTGCVWPPPPPYRWSPPSREPSLRLCS
nr:WAS/WASL-interacting protein family member 1-like [Aegilops tauschii subsp. strangulata]